MSTRTDSGGHDPVIESRDQLIAAFAKGAKPKDRWRIGTEHEKFVYSTKDHHAPAYEEKGGIHTLLIGLTAPVFTVLGEAISWRDLILLAGGLFLLVKATHEIHKGIEGAHDETGTAVAAGFGAVIAQIIVIDMVFSVDSIVTAIGMAEHIEVMVAAVVIAMIAMYVASGPISDFVQKHPTTKMLALAFLLLIGVALIADGLGFHIPRGYIYFAMAFSAGVEVINILAAARRKAKRQAAAGK